MKKSSHLAVSLETVLKNASYGDIIFFDTAHSVTQAIKYVCHTEWSHVGLVIELPDGKKCLLESIFHYIPLKDVFSGLSTTVGCRCVLLSERLLLHGDIGIKRFKNENFDSEEKIKIRHALYHFALNNSWKPYQESLFDLVRAWYDGPPSLWRPCGCYDSENENYYHGPVGTAAQVPDDDRGYFCTKFIADAIIKCGLSPRLIYYNSNTNQLNTVNSSEYIINDLLNISDNYEHEFLRLKVIKK